MASPRWKEALLALSMTCAMMGGCAGDISSLGAGLSPGTGPVLGGSAREVTFTCGTDTPSPSALRRLSYGQYKNAITDLLQALVPSRAAEIAGALQSPLTLLPADAIAKDAPFSTMDQSVSQAHVDAWMAVAEAVAAALTSDTQHVNDLLACNKGEAPDACVARFFQRLGRLAYRHKLNDAETAWLKEVYAAKGVDLDGLRDVITLVLNAPQFLYEVEYGDDAVGDALFAVKGSELATRLALHLWRRPPDDKLLARAEGGDLDDDKGFASVVESMLDDPRSQAFVREFVGEWLNLDSLRPLDGSNGVPAFDAFVGKDTPSATLRQAMIDEVLDSFQYHLGRNESYADWFASDYAFARDDELAALYGTPKWKGDGSVPPTFPQGERAGLITRAALLATGTTKTRPIIKGVFIRQRLLCDVVPPPPANATTVPPELAKLMGTREVVERLTEQKGSTCATCHSTQINPLGFATENFDALGRLRTKETLYGDDGSILGEKPVDTASVPQVVSGDTEPSRGAQDLMEQILSSGKAEACFARQYLRFAQGRMEDEKIDGCALESTRSALQDGQSLRQALRAPVLARTFRQRFLGEVP